MALAPGCRGGGGSNPMDGDPFAAPQVKAIKVTYIRFNWDPKNKRFVHEYRIMLSDGWRQKNGQNPREPFTKLWRDPFKAESIPDTVLDNLVKEMEKFGLNDLNSRAADSINLEELKKVEKLPYERSAEVLRWRIINLETDAGKKTVTFIDNDDRAVVNNGPQALKFSKVEMQVIKVAAQYTVQVTYDTPPMIPK